MNNYKVLFYYSQEDEAFVTCVPELPGCMSDGKTIKEAAQNTKTVINEWLETAQELGREVPKPIPYNDYTNAKSVDVAKYILCKTGKIKAMALEKLTYYCKVWSLVWYGKSLVSDSPEAWRNGPVFPELFHQHKHLKFVSEHNIESTHELSDDEKRIVDMVLEAYQSFDGDELSDMTHNETPWNAARKGMPPDYSSNEIITDSMIAEYYSQCSLI